jgi:uncharacterized protein (DUF885 family)
MLKDSPDLANSYGRREGAGQWQDLAPEAWERRKARWLQWQSAMKHFGRNELSETDQLYYDWLTLGVNERVEAARYPGELLAIDPLNTGPHISVPYRLRLQTVRTVHDYEALLELLRGVSRYVDQNIALLQKGVRDGIMPPAIILRELPAQMEKLTAGRPQDSQFMSAFRNIPASIPEAERQRLTREASALVDTGVFPAFRRLGTSWSTTTSPMHAQQSPVRPCRMAQPGTRSMSARSQPLS